MTVTAPKYDLVLLLDPKAEDAAREKIVADARSAVQAQGELLRHDEWGERALAYPIDRRTSAEYHLMQFHAGSPELLDGLNHTLRITDGVMRFRIIKLKPGVPDAPDMRSAAAPPRATEAPAEAPAAPQAPAEAAPAQAEAAPAQAEEAPAQAEEAPAQAEAAPAEAAAETGDASAETA